MSPLLSTSSILEPGVGYKFVRDGKVIAYDIEDRFHFEIAQEHNLGEKLLNDSDYHLLDDAGRIFSRDLALVVNGASGSCRLRESYSIARPETRRLVEEITGKKVETK